MRQGGYAAGHVPGAVYVSPVAIRDATSPPTFLPTPEAFADGISDAMSRRFDGEVIRRHAERFSRDRFANEMAAQIAEPAAW